MTKKLWDNSLVIGVLTAAILGAFAFWRSTETKLAVQETKINALEKGLEKLGDDLDELAKMIW